MPATQTVNELQDQIIGNRNEWKTCRTGAFISIGILAATVIVMILRPMQMPWAWAILCAFLTLCATAFIVGADRARNRIEKNLSTLLERTKETPLQTPVNPPH